MSRMCRQCGRPFTPRSVQVYCSPACREAAKRRTCRQCGRSFLAVHATDQRPYCSRLCSLQAAWVAPPRQPKAAACRHCGKVFTPRRGAVYCSQACREAAAERTCRWCGRPFTTSRTSEKGVYCSPQCNMRAVQVAGSKAAADARQARGRVAVCCCWRECPRPDDLLALHRCRVTNSGSRNHYHPECLRAIRASGEFFKDNKPWAHTPRTGRRPGKQGVRCTVCGETRLYAPCVLPRTVERATMTWTCPQCRPRKTVVRVFACPQCGTSFSRYVSTEAPPGVLRFCSLSCRNTHFADWRARQPPCRHCGAVINRRGRGAKSYCSWACYSATQRGRPHPHSRPSGAQRRILEAWRAGVRGVRALAKESHASVNTVRKLQQAGLLAAEQPAVSASGVGGAAAPDDAPPA